MALIRAYVLHCLWFVAMLAFVMLRWSGQGLKASVLLTLITVPPVLYYTVAIHALCRKIDPRARTVGWMPVLITTLVLSPFESGLILPLKNLLAANRLLRLHLAVDMANGNAETTRHMPPTSGAERDQAGERTI